MNDLERYEKIAQFALLSIFTLIITILALAFGFASALMAVAFMILKTSITLAIGIVDEIIVRKEAQYYATQRRGKSRVQAQGRV